MRAMGSIRARGRLIGVGRGGVASAGDSGRVVPWAWSEPRAAPSPGLGEGRRRRCGTGFTRAPFPRAQQAFERLAGHRSAEVIALTRVASEAPEEPPLRLGLDALRGHGQVQAVPEAYDGGRDGGRLRAGCDVAHEGPVDLQVAQGEPLYVGERRGTRPQVVQRED